ncbi:GtrA family protein [Candidatus Haliotispira prima]|uniref:GtrA family protein n=1 Tax=Candidatus Haliotispira prima TaxID=3034016 RepID=A0ABY8MG39_9SPIO|nr:GtrA family protein [Candidatus Haliotispira prima]
MLKAIRWLSAQSWLRYSLVGGLSSLVLFAVSNVLEMLGLPPQACTAWGWLATLPVSYFGQRYFTFDPKVRLHPLHLLFYGIAMLLILAGNQLATWALSMTDIPFLFVSLGVVLTVTLLGFTLFRNWVFKPYRQPDKTLEKTEKTVGQ